MTRMSKIFSNKSNNYKNDKNVRNHSKNDKNVNLIARMSKNEQECAADTLKSKNVKNVTRM